MSAIVRASRPAASVRTSTQRHAVVPRLAQLRSRNQPLMVCSAAEESGSIDSDKLIADIKTKWEAIDNKPQFVIYSVGALTALWFSGTILGAVDRVPVIPKAFELIGLGYSSWFTYRYLLYKSSREELIKDVEALKNKISGSSE